jgi:hypothetical protein
VHLYFGVMACQRARSRLTKELPHQLTLERLKRLRLLTKTSLLLSSLVPGAKVPALTEAAPPPSEEAAATVVQAPAAAMEGAGGTAPPPAGADELEGNDVCHVTDDLEGVVQQLRWLEQVRTPSPLRITYRRAHCTSSLSLYIVLTPSPL